MPRWRSIWLVARREILERGRSRGFLLSVAFTTLIVVGSFVLPAIFLGGDADVAPLTVAVSNLVNASTGQGWQLLTAAAFVAMAVPMAIFFGLQRYFVRGITGGSVKG